MKKEKDPERQAKSKGRKGHGAVLTAMKTRASTEVSTGVRVSDGALVVVDVVEGVSAQTHAVLRQVNKPARPLPFHQP